MTHKFQNKYRISSARLPNWDYGSNAAYFVTICTKNRDHFFGRVVNGEMHLSDVGQLVEKFWSEIPNHFPFVVLDSFVVMPNHVHGIVVIDKNDYGDGGIQNNGVSQDDGDMGDDGETRDDVETPNLGVSTTPPASPTTPPASPTTPPTSPTTPPTSAATPPASPTTSPASPTTSPASAATSPTSAATSPTAPGPTHPNTTPGSNPPDTPTGPNPPDTAPNTTRPGSTPMADPPTVKTNTAAASQKWKSGILGVILNQFKRICTINARKINPDFGWQSRFHDHVIRDNASFDRIRNYILTNPENWANDKFSDS